MFGAAIQGLRIGLMALAAALSLLGLQMGSMGWLQSIFDAQQEHDAPRNRGIPWLYRLTGGAAVEKMVGRARASLSRFALSSLGLLVAFLNGLNELLTGVFTGHYSFAWAVTQAIERIRTVEIPFEIKTAVIPVRLTARRALRQAMAAAAAAAWVRRWTFPKLRRHERLIATLLLPGLVALRKLVRTQVLPQIARLESTAGALGRTVIRPLRVRLSRLEKIMAGLLAGGVILRVIAKRWPWLFCRRTKTVGNRLCAMDASFLDSVLGSALLFTSVISLEAMAKGLREPTEQVEAGLSRIIRELQVKR